MKTQQVESKLNGTIAAESEQSAELKTIEKLDLLFESVTYYQQRLQMKGKEGNKIRFGKINSPDESLALLFEPNQEDPTNLALTLRFDSKDNINRILTIQRRTETEKTESEDRKFTTYQMISPEFIDSEGIVHSQTTQIISTNPTKNNLTLFKLNGDQYSWQIEENTLSVSNPKAKEVVQYQLDQDIQEYRSILAVAARENPTLQDSIDLMLGIVHAECRKMDRERDNKTHTLQALSLFKLADTKEIK